MSEEKVEGKGYTDLAIAAVEEFHKTFGLIINSEPTFNKSLSDFRVRLINEEKKELDDALEENDPVETLDALCDLQYVLSGAIVALGYKDNFNKAFAEVHRSNMSKACKNMQEVAETIAHYKSKGEECHCTGEEGEYIIRRDSDGKILKSINYSPADLTFIKGENNEV